MRLVMRDTRRFNPRPPHGRRPREPIVVSGWVSIHAPLTGGDMVPDLLATVSDPFQSTPPSREATGA